MYFKLKYPKKKDNCYKSVKTDKDTRLHGAENEKLRRKLTSLFSSSFHQQKNQDSKIEKNNRLCTPLPSKCENED